MISYFDSENSEIFLIQKEISKPPEKSFFCSCICAAVLLCLWLTFYNFLPSTRMSVIIWTHLLGSHIKFIYSGKAKNIWRNLQILFEVTSWVQIFLEIFVAFLHELIFINFEICQKQPETLQVKVLLKFLEWCMSHTSLQLPIETFFWVICLGPHQGSFSCGISCLNH